MSNKNRTGELREECGKPLPAGEKKISVNSWIALVCEITDKTPNVFARRDFLD